MAPTRCATYRTILAPHIGPFWPCALEPVRELTRSLRGSYDVGVMAAGSGACPPGGWGSFNCEGLGRLCFWGALVAAVRVWRLQHVSGAEDP
jgi:hypothetical protein